LRDKCEEWTYLYVDRDNVIFHVCNQNTCVPLEKKNCDTLMNGTYVYDTRVHRMSEPRYAETSENIKHLKIFRGQTFTHIYTTCVRVYKKVMFQECYITKVLRQMTLCICTRFYCYSIRMGINEFQSTTEVVFHRATL
jgi:hypothetical protein